MEKPREDIVEVGANCRIVVREVMRMVLYFDQPHESIREHARNVIEAFVRLVSLESFQYTFDMEGNPEQVDAETFSALMNDWFDGPYSSWPNANIRLVGAGGNAPEYLLNYCGKGLSETAFPNDRGYLDLWVPRGVFDTCTARFHDFFLYAASELMACSGYASPALAGKNKTRSQALAKRYYCLDIADPGAVSIDLGANCPGSYWLNYLGPSLAARFSAELLVQKLSSDVDVQSAPNGGLLVRLGHASTLGDRNRQQSIMMYQEYAKFIDGLGLLHVPRHVVYFSDAQALADREAQQAWHKRFIA